jgi:alpha-amylase
MNRGLGVLVACAVGAWCVVRGAWERRATEDMQVSSLRTPASVYWNGATVYFLLTDRFLDADTSNDHALGRMHDGAVMRSFEGGDFKGITAKIDAGYFDSLGIDAIWMTPFVENVHGAVDEGTGRTWGYHGYWTRDWTAVDPAYGTKADLHALVDAAHRHRIRVLMDAVINHTGPVTPVDPAWPASWVRTEPLCRYRDYASTVDCALVRSLPDIRTESDAPVELPPELVAKWDHEGTLAANRASLDAFFARTHYPRAPRYYVISWLTQWVREFGFDGYRVDTAKHFGEAVSAELKHESEVALADWRRAHPREARDSLPFYMVGEVYGWEESAGRPFDFGDRRVDFFAHGYDALINFGFKREIAGSLDSVFTRYAVSLVSGPLRGVSVLNYLANHDDGQPYDLDRRDPMGDAERLLLAPGGAQIYYGDELARSLRIPGTEGDANLRGVMNWADASTPATRAVLEHWRKLARFRQAHRAIGAGVHRTIQAQPFVFSRTLDEAGIADTVLVALDQHPGPRLIPTGGTFPDGTLLVDAYSGLRGPVSGGRVTLPSGGRVALLSRATGGTARGAR